MTTNFDFNDDSIVGTNVFVQKSNHHRGDYGLEYDSNTDAEFYAKIFETESYNHTQESMLDFYQDIYYLMNKKGRVNDRKSVKTILNKKNATTCGGKKNQIQRITQEEVYILKLQYLLKSAKIHETSSRHDINNLRLFFEMVLEETIAALNISIFTNQKAIKKYLAELRKFAIKGAYTDSMYLSYKLFKASFKQTDMKDSENLIYSAKRINAVFIPYLRLIESDEEFLKKHIKSHALDVYDKIKNLLENPAVQALSKGCKEHLATDDLLKRVREFMTSEVNGSERMIHAIGKGNPSVTQNTEFFSQPTSPHALGLQSSPLLNVKMVENGGVEMKDINLNVESAGEFANEQPKESAQSQNNVNADDNLKHEAVVKPQIQIKLNNLETIRQESENNCSHRCGPAPKPTFVTKKDNVEDESCDLSVADDGELKLNIEKNYIPEGANFVSTAKSGCTSLSRARGGSRYKALHRQEDSSIDTPMKRLQKMVTFNKNDSPRPKDRRFTAASPTNKRHTRFEHAVGFGDQSPIKISTSQNIDQPLVQAPSSQPEQEEVVEQPKVVLDDAYQRVLDIGNDFTSKWERVSDNALINVDKIMPEGSPVVLIRAWAFIEGFTPKEVFDQIFDTAKRAKWETVTMGLKVVEMIDENSQIMYFYVKTPIGISERDFVQRRNYMLDFPNKDEIVMTFKSVEHDDAPVLKNRIRAETHISGYIMRPSTRAPNSTDFCIISQSDIKGAIPKMLVNSVSARAPAEWIKKLIQACEKTRKEESQK